MNIASHATALVAVAALSVGGQAQAPTARQDSRPEKRIGVKTDVPGALRIDEPQATLAEVHQGATLEHRFTFRNGGRSTVLIEEGVALSGTGTVAFHPASVPPGATGEVLVGQPVGDGLGRAAFRFALITNEPGVARYRLGLTTFVESAYDPERPRLDFGVTDKGAASRNAEVEILSREVEALQVLEVLDAPPFLRVDSSQRAGLGAEGVRLRATLDAREAPLGVTRGTLRLRTNVPTQPECSVPYSLNVVGDVVPSRDTLSLGLVRLGEEATAELTLVSRSGRAVDVTAIEDSEKRVTAEAVPCPPDKASPACRVLRVKRTASERGYFSGTLSIRVAGLEGPLRIVYSGLVISERARVKEMDLTHTEDSDSDAAPMSKQAATPSVPAPTTPEPPPPAPVPTSQGVTLQWRARNESGVYGYLVYRGDKPSGPFVRVSREILRAAGAGEEIQSYSFVDKSGQPGRTYYYYLDVVDLGGFKKRFSGVKERQVAPLQ